MEELKLGAMTPPSQAWTTGRNAASVAFVNEGEQHLFYVSDPLKFTKLKEKIERVKLGQEDMNSYVEDWDAYIENL